MSLHHSSSHEADAASDKPVYKIYDPQGEPRNRVFDGLQSALEQGASDAMIAADVKRIRLRTMADFHEVRDMLRTESGRAAILALGSIRFVTDNDDVKRSLVALEGKKPVSRPAEETSEDVRVRVKTVLNNKQWRELDQDERGWQRTITHKTSKEREDHLASELRFVETQILEKEEGRLPVTMDIPTEKMLIETASFLLKYPDRMSFDATARKHVETFRAADEPKDAAVLGALRAARAKAAGPGPVTINLSGTTVTSVAVARELLLLAMEGGDKVQ